MQTSPENRFFVDMKKLVAVILLLLIALAAAGGVKTLDYTATIPDGYKLENMAVVAYVLRNFNDRPVFQSGSYGDWYVDNSRCAALGVTVLPEG